MAVDLDELARRIFEIKGLKLHSNAQDAITAGEILSKLIMLELKLEQIESDVKNKLIMLDLKLEKIEENVILKFEQIEADVKALKG